MKPSWRCGARSPPAGARPAVPVAPRSAAAAAAALQSDPPGGPCGPPRRRAPAPAACLTPTPACSVEVLAERKPATRHQKDAESDPLQALWQCDVLRTHDFRLCKAFLSALTTFGCAKPFFLSNALRSNDRPLGGRVKSAQAMRTLTGRGSRLPSRLPNCSAMLITTCRRRESGHATARPHTAHNPESNVAPYSEYVHSLPFELWGKKSAS